MDLDSLKYSELQKLAKSVGIKANQKTDKLLKALRDFYSKQNNDSRKKQWATTPKAGKNSPKNASSQEKERTTKRRRGTFELDDPGITHETQSPKPKAGEKHSTQEFDKSGHENVSPSKNGPPGKRRRTFELEEPSLSTGTPRQSGNTKRGSSSNKSTPTNAGTKQRKRHSTFELDEASLGAPATPEIDKTHGNENTKTPKTNGDENTKTPGGSSSPGVQSMIDSMSGEMNSAERKKRLMDAIDKKVEVKMRTSPRVASNVTNIPRFAAFLAQRKAAQKKPVTPGNKDWEKVHKRAFSQFDSLDVYLEKKRKRAEELTSSVKKARTVLHEVQEAVTKLKNKRTPSVGQKTADAPFKPTVTSTKNISFNFAANAASQKPKTPSGRLSTQSATKSFKPTVTSTRNMNLNFGATKTPNNGPAVKSVTSERKSVGGGRSVNSKQQQRDTSENVCSRKSFATPFKFTGTLNTSQAKSTTKPAFDLKASLARPMTWKPHTGKLKPVEFQLYGNKVSNSSTAEDGSCRMDMYKTHKASARAGRRAAAAAHRTEQKGRLQMKRRGITAAQ